MSWTPIRYVNRVYSRSVLAGLYRTARVGLVTPLRDGMNLVAKEYIAAQDPEDPGVLILSRFAGAAIGCRPRVARQSLRSRSRSPAPSRRRWRCRSPNGVPGTSALCQRAENDVHKWVREYLTALHGEDGLAEQIEASFAQPILRGAPPARLYLGRENGAFASRR